MIRAARRWPAPRPAPRPASSWTAGRVTTPRQGRSWDADRQRGGLPRAGPVAAASTDPSCPVWLLPLVGVGFCGALTTFSTLAFETWVFFEERAWRPFVANLVLSLGLGALAVVAGYAAGAALLWTAGRPCARGQAVARWLHGRIPSSSSIWQSSRWALAAAAATTRSATSSISSRRTVSVSSRAYIRVGTQQNVRPSGGPDGPSPVSGPNDPRDCPKCSSPVVTSGHAGVTCARTFRRQTGASLLDRSDTLSRRSDTPDRHRSPGRCRQAIVRDHESTSDQVVHKRESEPLAHLVRPICGRDCVRRLGRRWRRGRLMRVHSRPPARSCRSSSVWRRPQLRRKLSWDGRTAVPPVSGRGDPAELCRVTVGVRCPAAAPG